MPVSAAMGNTIRLQEPLGGFLSANPPQGKRAFLPLDAIFGAEQWLYDASESEPTCTANRVGQELTLLVESDRVHG